MTPEDEGTAMRMMRQLGREDWIAAGLVVLAREGWEGLRVQTVARTLGVSKGSFYWHFADRGAWAQAVLDYWEHRAFAAMLGCAAGLGPAVDAAVRDWAQHDMAAARAMARVRREGVALGAAPVARGQVVAMM
jgi:AcrR family transcriptional regulator